MKHDEKERIKRTEKKENRENAFVSALLYDFLYFLRPSLRVALIFFFFLLLAATSSPQPLLSVKQMTMLMKPWLYAFLPEGVHGLKTSTHTTISYGPVANNLLLIYCRVLNHVDEDDMRFPDFPFCAILFFVLYFTNWRQQRENS